jgi:uncharacterized protein (TIGR02598 family)
MTIASSPRRHLPKTTGFTLIEIALALSIVAFAVPAILGLLPLGLGVSRRALNTTVVSQIAQGLSNRALQADFSDLTHLADLPPLAYDDQGCEISPGQGTPIYLSAFEVPVDGVGKPLTKVSANTEGELITGRLATVKIHILNTSAQRSNRENNPKLSPDAEVFVVWVPDNGH